MAVMLLKNATKLGLAGGAMYWSIQEGVWGTSEEGAETMKRFASAIIPPSSEDDVKPTPKSAQAPTESVIAGAWNKGAKSVFQFAMIVPDTMSSYGNQAKSLVSTIIDDKILGKASESSSKRSV